MTDLLPGPGASLDPGDEWRPATLTGQYRPQDTVLLRNRPVGGETGYHVLVPFVDDSGIVLIIDRGLVPLGADATGLVTPPAPPSGTVTLTVTLRADEPPSARDAPPQQVQAISTDQVLAAGASGTSWANGRTVAAYGQLRLEDPAPEQAPRTVGAPEFGYDQSSSTNLSYVVQWLIFALGALGGYAILWRRETRGTTPSAGVLLAAGNDPDARAARRTRRHKGPTDEELEDALTEVDNE
jgi:cytochrome oxidase assembly protein ShyY1